MISTCGRSARYDGGRRLCRRDPGIEKGAPISIVRILVQTPPYELLAKPSITSLKELKGKTVSIGGAKDVTRIYLDRMLEPNRLKDGDLDLVYAGASSARLTALQSGAVDAAILTAPSNSMPHRRA